MNPLRLTGAEIDPAAGAEADPVESWLGVLRPLLSGPASERDGVVDELRDHLTQRVRELMVSGGRGGVRESEAVGIALSELGDAAAFARQWSSARGAPRRRLVMGIAAGFGVVAAGMGITAMSLLPSRAGTTAGVDEPKPVPVAVFEPAASEGMHEVGELRVSGMAGDTWEQFTREVGEIAKMPVSVSWARLGGLPIKVGNEAMEETTHLGVGFSEMKLSSALRLLNEARGMGELNGVDARVIDGCLVFSTAAAFDQAESVLVTYDLSGMPDIDIRGEAGTQEQIKDAIQAMVEPEHWANSGGDRATMAEVGTKLFIKAPKRMHKQVEWVLGEIKSTGKAEVPAGGVQAKVGEIIGASEIVVLGHAEAGAAASLVAQRLVEWSREVGGERFVVTKHGGENGVLVAGTAGARARALVMLREIDEIVGRGGRMEGVSAGGDVGVGGMSGSTTLVGLRRLGVPVLGEVPIVKRLFTSEGSASMVIRAESGLLRMTAPDGSSAETAELRIAPLPAGR